MTVSPHIIAAYANVSNEQLLARLADFERRGKAIAARIASGERSETVSIGISKGRWNEVTRLERSLNVLRSAWKQDSAILKARLNSNA